MQNVLRGQLVILCPVRGPQLRHSARTTRRKCQPDTSDAGERGASNGRHSTQFLEGRCDGRRGGSDPSPCSGARRGQAHGHAHQAVPSDLTLRVKSLESLLVEKGLVDRAALDAVDRHVREQGWTAQRRPRGGEGVGRSCVQAATAGGRRTARSRSSGTAASRASTWWSSRTRPQVHNMVVCTLCSCYPWPVLGLPPVWYKSAPYRSRSVIDPRGVLREFGLELPDDVEVRVWDSTAELRYLVLPERPAGTERLSEEQLAALVTRDAMVGVAKVLPPTEERRHERRPRHGRHARHSVPIRPEKNEPVFHARWEGRIYAHLVRAWEPGASGTSMLGRQHEGIDSRAEYLRISYYQVLVCAGRRIARRERAWSPAPSSKAASRRKGRRRRVPPLTADKVAALVREREPARNARRPVAPKFQVGQRVRARNINPRPIRACRAMRAARSASSRRDHGVFVFPDTNAQGLGREAAARLLGSFHRARTLGRAGETEGHRRREHVGRLSRGGLVVQPE